MKGVRTCAGCGAKRPKSEMIRVGTSGDEFTIIVACESKLGGRGSYVCPSLECARKARKSGGFARGLRKKVPDTMYDELELKIENMQRVSIG